MEFELGRALGAIRETDTVAVEGRVQSVVGLAIRASVPGARLGEVVSIERRGHEALEAEVVGFDLDSVTLLPLGDPLGVGAGDPVHPRGRAASVEVGASLLGRILDGLGRPIDGGGPLTDVEPWPVRRAAPDPLTRRRIDTPLRTSVRAIDGLMTLGIGQRVGLFSGSGVGKSTLLGRIAQRCDADVVVIGLIGERGREVREFIEDRLGPEGRKKSVTVVATSDAPALVRVRAAWVVTAIAEYFRDRGQNVLLVMDSVTRFARAAREVGLAAGEPPVRRGYPPSVFAALPQLLERSGNGERGSMTAIYSVLVEGSDLEEPIADEMRGILDGHIVLDRGLAARGRYPAIDPLRSISRVMPNVVGAEHLNAASAVREHLAVYEEKRDLVLLGAYERGRDARLDRALSRIDAIEGFLRQPSTEEDESLEAIVSSLRASAR